MKILSVFCIALLKAYRWFLAPLFMSFGVQCRFTPSCSQYAIEAIQVHGPLKGSALSGARVLRCHPFCKGGHDPVPASSKSFGVTHG